MNYILDFEQNEERIDFTEMFYFCERMCTRFQLEGMLESSTSWVVSDKKFDVIELFGKSFFEFHFLK